MIEIENIRKCKNCRGTGKVAGGNVVGRCLYCNGAGTINISEKIQKSNKIIEKCYRPIKVKTFAM